MTKILALSGSLRRDSLNTRLAHAIREYAPANVVIEIATLHGIPLYDGDVEAGQGIPDAVNALKARIVNSDGVLLVTPEYNGGMPGVMKNGIDWLSRTDIKAVFAARPYALAGATPGGWGTLSAQAAWLPVLNRLGVTLYAPSFKLSAANKAFNENGGLASEQSQAMVRDLLEGFSQFIHSEEIH